jgi:hypothetical protein
MRFVKFLIIWIASNLSIPFWMVGHVHLTTNVYQDITEILASMGMNIIVAIGFWLDWKQTKSAFPIGTEINFVQYGADKTTVVAEKGIKVTAGKGVKIKRK